MSRSLITRPGALQAPQLDYILVDGSSSMKDKWWSSMAALDGFLDVLKSRNAHSHGIVSVFDSHNLGIIHRDSLIAEWRSFAAEPLASTWGMTPLYDAINNMARHMRDLDPPNASIVILTDGDEIGSQFTDVNQARALLDWCRAKGWQVTFLGCDFDNDSQAAQLGANATNSIGVRKELLPEAGKLLGQRRANNMSDPDTDINFTEDEKTKFGGYLGGPST